jgi:hypothetical protein
MENTALGIVVAELVTKDKEKAEEFCKKWDTIGGYDNIPFTDCINESDTMHAFAVQLWDKSLKIRKDYIVCDKINDSVIYDFIKVNTYEEIIG